MSTERKVAVITVWARSPMSSGRSSISRRPASSPARSSMSTAGRAPATDAAPSRAELALTVESYMLLNKRKRSRATICTSLSDPP
jgi:hypothetical protein